MKRSTILIMTILILQLLNFTYGGPLAMGLCYTGCNTVWVACVAGAGGVAGVSTGGIGVPAAILACNSAQGICMGLCSTLLLAPTL